jgi:hypothetical protein
MQKKPDCDRADESHAVAQLIQALAASRKVAGSIPDEVIEFFFSIHLILPAAPLSWG